MRDTVKAAFCGLVIALCAAVVWVEQPAVAKMQQLQKCNYPRVLVLEISR